MSIESFHKSGVFMLSGAMIMVGASRNIDTPTPVLLRADSSFIKK